MAMDRETPQLQQQLKHHSAAEVRLVRSSRCAVRWCAPRSCVRRRASGAVAAVVEGGRLLHSIAALQLHGCCVLAVLLSAPLTYDTQHAPTAVVRARIIADPGDWHGTAPVPYYM